MPMRMLSIAIVLLLSGMAQAAPVPEIAPACADAPTPQQVVDACSEFLKKSNLATDQRTRALLKRGDAYAKLKSDDLALQDYNAVIELNPKLSVVYNQRGNVFSNRGEYELAIKDYSTAIAIQEFPVRYANRGRTYRLMGDLDRALADLSAAIRLKGDESRPFVERAIVYRLKLDYPKALADNNVAVRIDPENAVVFRERARTHEARGDLKAALADFRQVLLLAPRDERTKQSVARIEARIANPDPAAQAPAAADVKAPVDPKQQAQRATRPAGQRVALVIGNARYGNVTPLANPKNDAEALSKALRNVGFTSVTLKLDQTREQLAGALKEFAALADRAEWAVIYYAGHGIEVGGNNYLVPVDARFSSDRDVSFEAVTLDQVLQSVEGASKLRLVILDACRDNPFVAKMTKGSGTRSIGKGLGNIEPEGATLVAYAAKHGQTAEDGQTGNSPFAMALVKQIQTPGQEINLVFRKVRDEVLAATGKRQEPFTYGSLPSEAFYFKAN